MYVFSWIMCGVSLAGLAMHLLFFARIVKGSYSSQIRDTRTRLIPFMESLSYIIGIGLLFLTVWVPLRHHSEDMDNRFLLPALSFIFFPNLYFFLKKRFFDNRTKSIQTPDAE